VLTYDDAGLVLDYPGIAVGFVQGEREADRPAA
jgi:hypothetical protein